MKKKKREKKTLLQNYTSCFDSQFVKILPIMTNSTVGNSMI